MVQTQQHETKTAGKRQALRAGKAGNLLHKDHEKVLAMFKEYAGIRQGDGDAARKPELAERICMELKVHARIEEEIFYPAMRESSESISLVNEAEVEHASAKQLIKEIESMQPEDKLFDAKIKVLGEYVRHHVREEEEQMFPLAEKAGIDTAEMADNLEKRKQELLKKTH